MDLVLAPQNNKQHYSSNIPQQQHHQIPPNSSNYQQQVNDSVAQRYPLKPNMQVTNQNVAPLHPLVSMHRPSRSVVHVRENSLDELDKLFDPSKWPNKKTNLPPLVKRNLPPSFFRPPETGGTKTPKLHSTAHSRQGSVDQTNLQTSNIMLNQQHLLLQKKLNGLSNLHSRSASEPVSVMPPYLTKQYSHQMDQSLLQPISNQSNHIRQQSNLPYGWQSAISHNGQQYFVKLVNFKF